MENRGSIKITNGINRVLDYALKKPVCHTPLYLGLGITNNCNLRCIMCPNKLQDSFENKGFMDFKVFKKIVDDTINVVQHIAFSYCGEALLHPDVVNFVKYINNKNPGVIVGIVTNATLLTKEMSMQLINAGLKSITFSFDSFDPKKYEEIRVGAKYDVTLENISNFLDLKEKYNKNIFTSIAMISDFNTEFSIPSVLEGRIKINKIPLHNYGGNINLTDKKKWIYFPCRFPWSSIVVSWNGNILACCLDHYEKEIIANVKDGNVVQLWNSEKMQTIRKMLADNNLPKLCEKCDMLQHASITHIMKKVFSVYGV